MSENISNSELDRVLHQTWWADASMLSEVTEDQKSKPEVYSRDVIG